MGMVKDSENSLIWADQSNRNYIPNWVYYYQSVDMRFWNRGAQIACYNVTNYKENVVDETEYKKYKSG